MIFKPKCPKCGSTESFIAVADFEGEAWADVIANDNGELTQVGEYSLNDCAYAFFNKRFQCGKCQHQFKKPDKEPFDDEAKARIRHEQSEQRGQINFLTGANKDIDIPVERKSE